MGDLEKAEELRRQARFTDWFESIPRSRRDLIYWGIEYPASNEEPYGQGVRNRRPARDHGHIAVVGLSDVLERKQKEKLQPKKEEKKEMWDGLF